MQYVRTLGRSVSRFVLGTVQLGLDYGIANRTGKPSREQAFLILDTAAELGVNTLDTARAYGDSEAVVGEWLQERGRHERVLVATKIPDLTHERTDPAALRRLIRNIVDESRRRLGYRALPLFMLHVAADMTSHDGLVLEEVLRLRREGVVEHVGVSVYRPDEAEAVLAHGGLDAVQAPMNVFDNRLVASGFLDRAATAGLAVFARSVFLQGLIPMPVDEVPAHLAEARQLKTRLEEIARDCRRTVNELAVQAILARRGVTAVVLGAETAGQVRENAMLVDRPPLEERTLRDLDRAFREVSERLLDPRQWTG